MKHTKQNKHLSLKQNNDLGFSLQATHQTGRTIREDGTFNVEKIGMPRWELNEIYNDLITMPWGMFLGSVFLLFFALNLTFTIIYLIAGSQHLHGIIANNFEDSFFETFFFSSQTLTSLGYGRINPASISTNIIAMFESMIGLLTFALVTGLLYGRFSRPIAKILYSENILISPYKDKTALMFRIANLRKRELIEVEVVVIISFNAKEESSNKRNFFTVKLERDKISFFPLSWTVVHPIDEDSPLLGLEMEDFKEMELGAIIHVKGFDEISSQTVHSKYSYQYGDIVWGARFEPIFKPLPSGTTRMDLNKINDHVQASLELN